MRTAPRALNLLTSTISLTNFQYIHHFWALGAVALLAVLFFLLLRWKRRVIKKMGDPALVKELTRNHSPRLFNLKAATAVAALALCVVALANLRRPGDGENINRKGIDVVFALDVSKSMLAEDVKPSRLERAKLLINKLSDRLANDKIGLVLFAGRAYTQMPLTTDHATARIFVNNARTESAPTQGTVIGEALRTCNTSFSNKDKKYKAVVLITDGEDHDGKAVKEAAQLKDSGVLVFAVGMGSEEGSAIIDPLTHDFKKDENGKNVLSKLNAPLLQQIAAATGGSYFYHDDTEAVAKKIEKQLGGMEGRLIEDKTFMNYTGFYFWFVLAALVLLVAEALIPETKKWQTLKQQMA
jgi:Ca-activated chloride channel homolog